MDWAYRKHRIAAEIRNIDADIICLSEVDHYSDYFQPFLESQGYTSVYKKKRGWHSDGLCISFRSQRFIPVFQHYIYFPNSNQLALVVKLLLGSIEILVVSTHLKSGGMYERDRKGQINYLLMRLSRYGNIPMIMCGDFNCEPESPTYNAILSHQLKFKSAYFGRVLHNSEPEITTYKMRETVEYKTIDYVFIKGFNVNSVLSIPKLKDIEKAGLPSKEYPSDHLSLSCKVEFIYESSL